MQHGSQHAEPRSRIVLDLRRHSLAVGKPGIESFADDFEQQPMRLLLAVIQRKGNPLRTFAALFRNRVLSVSPQLSGTSRCAAQPPPTISRLICVLSVDNRESGSRQAPWERCE